MTTASSLVLVRTWQREGYTGGVGQRGLLPAGTGNAFPESTRRLGDYALAGLAAAVTVTARHIELHGSGLVAPLSVSLV